MLLITVPALAQNTILIIGDSLSAGYGIDPTVGWVSLLKQRLQTEKYDYNVVNASISGDTLSNGLARAPAALTSYKPAITIIELGGNDALRGLPITTIQQNLLDLIALAKNAGSQVLVLGVRVPPNYGPTYAGQFQALYQQLNAVCVVPLFLNGVDVVPALMQSDGIHPNAKAQAILLDNVWPTLKILLH